MIVIDNFNQVAAQIENERGITKETLVSAIEQALVSACRRKFHDDALLEGELNPETGEARIFQLWNVVEEVDNEYSEMDHEEAQKFRPSIEVGDVLKNEVRNEDIQSTK